MRRQVTPPVTQTTIAPTHIHSISPHRQAQSHHSTAMPRTAHSRAYKQPPPATRAACQKLQKAQRLGDGWERRVHPVGLGKGCRCYSSCGRWCEVAVVHGSPTAMPLDRDCDWVWGGGATGGLQSSLSLPPDVGPTSNNVRAASRTGKVDAGGKHTPGALRVHSDSQRHMGVKSPAHTAHTMRRTCAKLLIKHPPTHLCESTSSPLAVPRTPRRRQPQFHWSSGGYTTGAHAPTCVDPVRRSDGGAGLW